jgi:hypothetical protein
MIRCIALINVSGIRNKMEHDNWPMTLARCLCFGYYYARYLSKTIWIKCNEDRKRRWVSPPFSFACKKAWKWAEAITQATECLHSKCKTQSKDSNITKNKKKKREEEEDEERKKRRREGEEEEKSLGKGLRLCFFFSKLEAEI